MVGVYEHESISISDECEGCFVALNSLVSKGLENLFQSCLRNTILFYAKSSFFNLELAKEPSNCFAFLGNAQFEEFSALLEDFNMIEMMGEIIQNS